MPVTHEAASSLPDSDEADQPRCASSDVFWNRVCMLLPVKIGEENFERWFSTATAEATDDGKVILKPKSWRELKDGVAVVAPEVKTREDAEALKGTRLFVPRANLPPTAEDEFYVVDLLGSRAEALDGTVLGEICAVWNFGAGDIIEYRPPNGGPNVRITFTKETVPHVDLAAKRVVIDPPAPEPTNGK